MCCNIHRVTGDTGVKGNVIITNVAKKEVQGTRVPRDILTSIIHLKKKAEEETLLLWKIQWHTSKHRRIYRGTTGTNITAPLRRTISTRKVSTITHMRTGYTCTNSYQLKIPMTDLHRPCNCGNHYQTLEHILLYRCSSTMG